MKEEKQVTYIEKFVKFPTFIRSFVREGNLFAGEAECWRFNCPECDLQISVIRSSTSYGGRQGLFELAFMLGDEVCERTELCYDVVGYLTEDEVLEYLEKGRKLQYDPEKYMFVVVD